MCSHDAHSKSCASGRVSLASSALVLKTFWELKELSIKMKVSVFETLLSVLLFNLENWTLKGND